MVLLKRSDLLEIGIGERDAEDQEAVIGNVGDPVLGRGNGGQDQERRKGGK